MEAIFHTPIVPVLKFIVLNGNANIGKNGSRITKINAKIPATPVVIKDASEQRFISKLQFALLIVIFTNNDPVNATAVITNGIAINAFCRRILIENTMNTDAAIRTPIIEERDNLKSELDMFLKYSLVL